VLVAVGEGVIVRVGEGEGITAVTGVFVGSEVVTSTDELLVHAATTAIVQNSNIIHLSSFNFVYLSSPTLRDTCEVDLTPLQRALRKADAARAPG